MRNPTDGARCTQLCFPRDLQFQKRRALPLILLGLLLLPIASLDAAATALTITAGGAWIIDLDISDIAGGTAGAGFVMPQASPDPQVTLSATGMNKTKPWNITVSRDTGLPTTPAVTLEIRRRSDGTGIDGGTVDPAPALGTYLTVTSTATTIVSGSGDRGRTGLTFQFRIGGVTVAVGPGSWVTTLTYTLTAN